MFKFIKKGFIGIIFLLFSIALTGCSEHNVKINDFTYEADLTFLDLSGTELDKEDFKQLGKLKQLKILNLSDTKIDDLEGLEKLVNLEEINLYNSYIKYYTIDTLCELKNLNKANLIDSTISYNYEQMEKFYEKFPNADISPSFEEALSNNMATFNVEAKLCCDGVMSYLYKCTEKLPPGIYTGALFYMGDFDYYSTVPKSGADGLNEWLCLYTFGGIPREKSKCGGYYSVVIEDNSVIAVYFSDKNTLLNETDFSQLHACTSDYIVGSYPENGVIDWIAESERGK